MKTNYIFNLSNLYKKYKWERMRLKKMFTLN